MIENGKPGARCSSSTRARLRYRSRSPPPIPRAASGSPGRAGATAKPRSSPPRRTATGFRQPAAVASSLGQRVESGHRRRSQGRVTVAWDSYRNGNYDVYLPHGDARRAPGARRSRWPHRRATKPILVAYDPAGTPVGRVRRRRAKAGARISAPTRPPASRSIRAAPCGWWGSTADGKRGHDQRAILGDCAARLAMPSTHRARSASERLADDWTARTIRSALRRRSRDAERRARPRSDARRKNTPAAPAHRIPPGRFWLAFRSAHPGLVESARHGVDGIRGFLSTATHGRGPIYLHHTDNLLDNRPALVSTRRAN